MKVYSSALVALILLMQGGCGRGPASEPTNKATNDQRNEGGQKQEKNVQNDFPFGLPSAKSLQELDIKKKASFKNMWMINPPTPHSRFRDFAVIFQEGAGICGLQATSGPRFLESIDQEFRNVLREIADSLASKYGKYVAEDQCPAGEDVCQRTGDSYNLINGSRVLRYKWDFDSERSDGLKHISLHAFGFPSSDNVFYSLQYDFGGRNGCMPPFESNDVESL